MRISISNKILIQLKKYIPAKTSAEAVNKALADWIRHFKTGKLRALRGQFQIENNWKNLRALELRKRNSS